MREVFISRRRAATLVVIGASSWAWPGTGFAVDDFPRRPITIVLPYQAGSGTDQVARLMAQRMSEQYKVPVLIDNRPGANGFIAARFVAKAPPDGYTLLLSGGTTQSAGVFLYKNLPFDPVKDFTPVSLVYKGFMVLLVNSASPVMSMADLVAHARREPGQVTYGAGSATARIAAEMFRQTAGLQLVHVPYKSNPQAVADLLGGQVDFLFTDGPTALPQVASGKLRALAVSGAERLSRLPAVPTMDQAGVKGFELAVWTGLYLPAGASPALTERLNTMVHKSLEAPEMKTFETTNVTTIVTSTPEGLARFQAEETEKTGRVIRAAGIEPE
ncbi:tripartite tricarboxylate transporter substrate binding protein [Xylophilus sp. GOD-11R]|uniref:Bug family tripartite tricarboxylate transporter substrate binding protein n=1 Tax=Xylophilus sp. GOD-11R TaxID=3089814 RepID=UPI00298D4E73|nr:tripartite tricarboxylate transporter substrate binding protein [Xylophilus sp. GOD-11R]WPB55920.1 tripartite tricarboxylate transporter substrate binding protein [Xylophilus sp. GOD-11R]